MSPGTLDGCRVLVTRPEGQAERLNDAIEAAGGEVLHFPVIRIAGRTRAEVDRELGSGPRPDIVVFVSSNAVRHGYASVRGRGAVIAAVGPATRDTLERAGASVDIFPETGYDSEGLLAHPALADVAGKSIVILRGDGGRELLADTLASRGAGVRHVTVYERQRAVPDPSLAARVSDALTRREIDFVVVMSAETVTHLLALLPGDARDALRATRLVAPGARVIQTATELVPGGSAVMASGPTPADIVAAIADAWQSGKTA